MSSRASEREKMAPSEILKNFLYVGNEEDARDFGTLMQLGIYNVVNLSRDLPCYFEEMELFDYLKIPTLDCVQEDLKQHFHAVIDFIDRVRREKGKVLIHCRAGISRSVTLCAAYLLYYSKSDVMEVLNYIKRRRSIAAPNIGFLGQLFKFQQELNTYRDIGVKPWLDLTN